MTGITARFALDLLEAGQAQKEIAHNEAIAAIDLLLHASVVDAGLDAPPADPVAGRCWIVGATPGGAWAGHALAIAGWTGAGGWRFLAARPGMVVWDERRGIPLRFEEGSWQAGVLRGTELRIGGDRVVSARGAAIATPAGGATVDGEARAAIAAMLEALRGHGLIAG